MFYSRLFIILSLLLLAFQIPIIASNSFTLGVVLEPPHLDPTRGAAGAIDEIVYANVFEGLTGINHQGKVIPKLAVKWEASKNADEFIFHLQKNVKFHDGQSFTASDVKFSFDRAAAADSENAQKRVFTNISEITIQSDYQLTIKLKQARGNFPWLLGLGDSIIVSSKSQAKNKTSPIGTGPFKFDRWKNGVDVKLVKNKSYWGKPTELDTVKFRFISDPNAAYNAMITGDVDGFANFPAPELVEQFRGDKRFVVNIGQTEGETILAINNRQVPFNDLKVRQAVSYAINKTDIINGAMFGLGTPIGSHSPPAAENYHDLTNKYSFNVKKAKSLLAEAGYPDGFKTTIHLPPPTYARRGGEIIAAQLREIGIEAELIPVEWAQWLTRVFKNKEYDLTIISHTEPKDIEIYSRPNYYFNYANEAFAKIMEDLNATAEPKKRRELEIAGQQKLADDAVNVFLFMLSKNGVWKADAKGLWLNSPVQSNDMTNVYWSNITAQ